MQEFTAHRHSKVKSTLVMFRVDIISAILHFCSNVYRSVMNATSSNIKTRFPSCRITYMNEWMNIFIWVRPYYNKAIRDGRPRPPRHQVGWDIPLHFDTNPESLRPFVAEIWPNNVFNLSVEKWLRYYTLKFCENTDKHTDTQTDRHGHYNTSPSPYGGRGKYRPAYTGLWSTIILYYRHQCNKVNNTYMSRQIYENIICTSKLI